MPVLSVKMPAGGDVDLSTVRGHRQVTDAYLVVLATAHGGVLATLDEGLHRDHPGGTVLLPEVSPASRRGVRRWVCRAHE